MSYYRLLRSSLFAYNSNGLGNFSMFIPIILYYFHFGTSKFSKLIRYLLIAFIQLIQFVLDKFFWSGKEFSSFFSILEIQFGIHSREFIFIIYFFLFTLFSYLTYQLRDFFIFDYKEWLASIRNFLKTGLKIKNLKLKLKNYINCEKDFTI